MSRPLELVSQPLGSMLGATEHDRRDEILPFQQLSQRVELVLLRNRANRVLDRLSQCCRCQLYCVRVVEQLGGEVVECAFVIDLPDLNGKEKIKGYNIFSLMEFEGE